MSERDQVTVEVGSEGRRTAVSVVLWAQARALARNVIDTSPRALELIGRPDPRVAHNHLVPLRELVVALGRIERVALGDHGVALPIGRQQLVRRIDWLLSLRESEPDSAPQLASLWDELRHWRAELD